MRRWWPTCYWRDVDGRRVRHKKWSCGGDGCGLVKVRIMITTVCYRSVVPVIRIRVCFFFCFLWLRFKHGQWRFVAPVKTSPNGCHPPARCPIESWWWLPFVVVKGKLDGGCRQHKLHRRRSLRPSDFHNWMLQMNVNWMLRRLAPSLSYYLGRGKLELPHVRHKTHIRNTSKIYIVDNNNFYCPFTLILAFVALEIAEQRKRRVKHPAYVLRPQVPRSQK